MSRNLRVLFLSTIFHTGGAGKAAFRLAESLKRVGLDVAFLAQNTPDPSNKAPGDIVPSGRLPTIREKIRIGIDQLPVYRYYGRLESTFSPAIFGGSTWKKINRINPDIVHAHWINKAFISTNDLARIRAPIVWTLHDMWPLTGGCHYSDSCERFIDACGNCPVLGSHDPGDISSRYLVNKQLQWQEKSIRFVAPSTWMKNLAMSSRTTRDRDIRQIPYCIDTDLYTPRERNESRRILGIPTDVSLVVFGAMSATTDRRKGFQNLVSALEVLPTEIGSRKLMLGIFGSESTTPIENSRIPVHSFGVIRDEELLTKIYSAADVFVVPSLQDNLPNTIMESLSCGTPVVTHEVGGIPDLVRHKFNGFLANADDPLTLAEGIRWVLSDHEQIQKLSENCRSHCLKHFSYARISRMHLDLYQELLAGS